MTNPVTGLRAVARYTQIDVVWDAQPGAPWYWVRAKIAGRQVRWLTVCQPPTTGMVTLRNMDQGTDYTITIWAGPDGPGNNASVTCTTKGAKPAAPMASVSTTVPCPGQPPPPEGGVNFAADPSAHGFPDGTNTGPPGMLNVLQRGVAVRGTGWAWDGGTLNVSGDGAVCEGFSVPGQAFITGDRATLRNCLVEASAFNGNGLTLDANGYTVDHCTIRGANALSGGLDAGIKNAGGDSGRATGTIRWCNIYNARSGIQDVAGLVDSCYIHDLRHAAGDHINGLTQNGGSAGLTVRHCTIFNAYSQTDCVGLFGDFGQEANDTVEGNLLAGGGYTIYGGGGGPGGNPANIKILNNRISVKYWPKGGYWGWIAYAGVGCEVSGNIWDSTGKPCA